MENWAAIYELFVEIHAGNALIMNLATQQQHYRQQ